MKGRTLQLRMLPAARPSPVLQGAIDKEKLIIRGVPDNSDQDNLIKFMEDHGDCDVKECTESAEPGTYLVEYDGIPGRLADNDYCVPCNAKKEQLHFIN